QSLHQQGRIADGRLRLLTIGHSRPAESEGIDLLELQPLDPDPMRRVVQEQAPDFPREHVEFVVRFADGYVKLARITCDALLKEPDIQGLELLRRDGNCRGLMNRLLGGNVQSGMRHALHVVALLSRVGWSGDLEAEGQAVAAHLGLDWYEV